ncbi:sugar-binding transcriptional regulator, partial [Aduncisulcus paluster]
MTIGISWGRTVRSTIKYLPPKSASDVKIVELFGAISYDMDDDMLSIGNELSTKLSGKFFPLPAPVYIDDSRVKSALERNPVIQRSYEMIENCDLILTGLGAVDEEA